MLLWWNCVQWVKLVPAHSNSARLTASLTSQLHFQGSTLALGRPICPQMHCTQYDPLVLGGELYLRFLSLPCPVSQNSHKQVTWDFRGILYIWRNTCVMCYRMWKRHVSFSLSSIFCISGIFRIHISGQPYHIISDVFKGRRIFMQFMQALMLSGVASVGRKKQTNLYLYTEQ